MWIKLAILHIRVKLILHIRIELTILHLRVKLVVHIRHLLAKLLLTKLTVHILHLRVKSLHIRVKLVLHIRIKLILHLRVELVHIRCLLTKLPILHLLIKLTTHIRHLCVALCLLCVRLCWNIVSCLFSSCIFSLNRVCTMANLAVS